MAVPPGVPDMSEMIGTFRLDLLLKLSLAVVLGGAIGLEREIAGKPAGLRTNILICMGAALLTDVSIGMTTVGGVRVGDPSRLAAQIITGIGFLGAGSIMQARGTITGLTTAATIWVVAAIGITVGAGHYLEAAGAGVLVTVVLAGLGNVEHRVRRARRVLSCTVRAKPGFSPEELEVMFGASGIKVLAQRIYDHGEDRVFELKLSGPAVQFDVVTEKILVHQDIFGVHLS
jgi:putative Mg2+ transporter-C (MgtC) family protein